MSATLLDIPTETPETSVSCENCPAVQRLERELEKLRAEFRCEVGYWKSQHADAVKRIEQLTEELDQARGQVRALQDKLFGRKSEKSAGSDRSNDLFDPEEVSAPPKKRGAQPGHAGHGRRDYSHLPVEEEFVSLPEESLALSDLRKAGRDDVGHGGFGGAGDRRAGASAADSAATLSGDVRLRSRATNACGPAAAETDSQRQLRHLDLGACLVGQVFVVSAHGAVARATRTVRFGLAGRHGQRRAATDRADVAADLRGVLPAESARRLPSGRRNPLAGFRAFGREKGLWLVVVGHSRRGHGDLSARSQPRPRGAAVAFWPTRLRGCWKSIGTRATKP